jgi:hypothetical protein
VVIFKTVEAATGHLKIMPKIQAIYFNGINNGIMFAEKETK